MREPMSGYNFACKDIGMTCGFEIRGATSRDEILQEAAAHAKNAHKMEKIPSEIATQLAAAIRG
jgi:predicted small metal-binding protein